MSEQEGRNPRPTSAGRLLRRAALRRCAACGGGGLFTGWFRMRERCPSCGYVFAREDGFALGAILMNFAVAELLLAVVGIIPLIAVLAANPTADVTPVVAGAALAVVLGPVLFHPFSRTLWVALELLFRPAGAEEPHDKR